MISTVLALVLSLTSADSKLPKVLWVPFEGTVELGLSPYIQRAIQIADKENYDLLVLETNTLGGRVDAAIDIRDALLRAKTPTATWVNKRAISAGALISLATKKIYFSSGSTMGAATPIQIGDGEAKDAGKKFVSYFRAEMGATAEKTGRSRKIAEAMVQATEDIPGLVKKDDVLTLTDVTALSSKISDGTADTREEFLKKIGLPNAEIKNFEINWAERAVRFFTDPTVSSALMSIGILALFLELQTPGIGVAGLISAICFLIFFFGRFLVNLAGFEELIFFLIGVGLIMLEFLLLPGKMIPAITGLILILGAFFFSGISPNVPLDFSFPTVADNLNSVAVGFIISLVGLFAVYWYFSRHPRKGPLVLESEQLKGGGHSLQEQAELLSLKGQRGVLISDLRPSGKMQIGQKHYQVVSDGAFLHSGTTVEVIETDGYRILVRPI